MKPNWTYFPIEDTHNDTCYGISMRDKFAFELYKSMIEAKATDHEMDLNSVKSIAIQSYKLADVFIEISDKVWH